MAKRKLNITEEERQRRSIAIRIRNAWAKEGKPGGDAELKRRKSDPAVVGAICKAQGWALAAGLAPKNGPPQPPAPPAKAKMPAAPPAPPKDRPFKVDSDAFCILFPGLD